MSAARLSGAAVAVLAVLTLVAGCSSSSPSSVSSGSHSTAGSGTASEPATTTTMVPAGHLPTVPNCGGGAYEPATLLIVCGVGTTMATGVKWASWTTSTAEGTGLVHLTVTGHESASPAVLALDEVVTGPVGPQFSRLTVTWSGSSPDGRAADQYKLSVGAP